MFRWGRLGCWLLAAGSMVLPAVSARADDAITDHSPSGFVKYVFQAAQLETAWGDKLAFYTNAVMAIAFLFLTLPSVLGLIKRGINPESIFRYVVRPIILCGFIAIVPEMKVAMSDGMNELANSAGYNGLNLVSSYYTETSIFDLQQTTHDLKDTESTDDSLFKKLSTMVSYIRNAFHWVIQYVISIPFAILLAVLGIVTQIGILIGDFVRTVLIDVGYALLPLFIAGLNFGPLQHASQVYIKKIIWLHMWPLAWSLVGVVTVTMVHLLHVYVHDVFNVAASANVLTFTAANLFLIWDYLPIGTLAVVALVMIIATTWQIYGLYKAPKMIHDVIISGSLPFEGWWGPVLQSSMQTFSKAALAGAALVALPAAAAAAPAALGAAGGAGGAAAVPSFMRTLAGGARIAGSAVADAMREGHRRGSGH